MNLKILKRREDGGIEIEPPKVAATLPMPAVIAQGNMDRRVFHCGNTEKA